MHKFHIYMQVWYIYITSQQYNFLSYGNAKHTNKSKGHATFKSLLRYLIFVYHILLITRWWLIINDFKCCQRYCKWPGGNTASRIKSPQRVSKSSQIRLSKENLLIYVCHGVAIWLGTAITDNADFSQPHAKPKQISSACWQREDQWQPKRHITIFANCCWAINARAKY